MPWIPPDYFPPMRTITLRDTGQVFMCACFITCTRAADSLVVSIKLAGLDEPILYTAKTEWAADRFREDIGLAMRQVCSPNVDVWEVTPITVTGQTPPVGWKMGGHAMTLIGTGFLAMREPQLWVHDGYDYINYTITAVTDTVISFTTTLNGSFQDNNAILLRDGGTIDLADQPNAHPDFSGLNAFGGGYAPDLVVPGYELLIDEIEFLGQTPVPADSDEGGALTLLGSGFDKIVEPHILIDDGSGGWWVEYEIVSRDNNNIVCITAENQWHTAAPTGAPPFNLRIMDADVIVWQGTDVIFLDCSY